MKERKNKFNIGNLPHCKTNHTTKLTSSNKNRLLTCISSHNLNQQENNFNTDNLAHYKPNHITEQISNLGLHITGNVNIVTQNFNKLIDSISIKETEKICKTPKILEETEKIKVIEDRITGDIYIILKDKKKILTSINGSKFKNIKYYFLPNGEITGILTLYNDENYIFYGDQTIGPANGTFFTIDNENTKKKEKINFLEPENIKEIVYQYYYNNKVISFVKTYYKYKKTKQGYSEEENYYIVVNNKILKIDIGIDSIHIVDKENHIFLLKLKHPSNSTIIVRGDKLISEIDNTPICLSKDYIGKLGPDIISFTGEKYLILLNKKSGEIIKIEHILKDKIYRIQLYGKINNTYFLKVWTEDGNKYLLLNNNNEIEASDDENIIEKLLGPDFSSSNNDIEAKEINKFPEVTKWFIENKGTLGELEEIPERQLVEKDKNKKEVLLINDKALYNWGGIEIEELYFVGEYNKETVGIIQVSPSIFIIIIGNQYIKAGSLNIKKSQDNTISGFINIENKTLIIWKNKIINTIGNNRILTMDGYDFNKSKNNLHYARVEYENNGNIEKGLLILDSNNVYLFKVSE